MATDEGLSATLGEIESLRQAAHDDRLSVIEQARAMRMAVQVAWHAAWSVILEASWG